MAAWDRVETSHERLGAAPHGRRASGTSGADPLEDAYVRNVGAALRLAYFLTGSRDQAEDLVHEAFARVAARLRHRRSVDDLDAYLRRTVVNLFSSSLRRRRTERAWMSRQHPPEVIVQDDPAERDAMWRALQALPDRQRAAVVLRYYEDLSEQDAADVLGCSPRALNSLVVRAMRTLRSDLGGEAE
jgi:RNA polymerase sigma-70 factor (sigma-E family)